MIKKQNNSGISINKNSWKLKKIVISVFIDFPQDIMMS